MNPSTVTRFTAGIRHSVLALAILGAGASHSLAQDDRVHMGANAVILGKITIGNDAVIGPGAVVMNSVPPCGVAMGNPARVVGDSGSFEFVNYDGMENDSERKPPTDRKPEPGKER